MTEFKTDKVTLEIMKSYFVAIAEGMGYTLERTSHTTFIKESADFTTGIATPEGEFFAYPRNIGVTSFLGLNLRKAIESIDHYKPGDVIITNDPYNTEGLVTHLPDIHLFKPIFHNGNVICFAWCFIHSSDVGGLVPASISPKAYDIQQEGLRIPPCKLYNAGHLDDNFLQLFLSNCRIPDKNWGDLKAMLAALNTAEMNMEKLINKFNIEIVKNAMEDMINWTEKSVRKLFEQIPDGEYTFSDYMDDDMDGCPIHLRITLKIQGSQVDLDFTGSDPQVNAAFNLPAFGNKHPFLAQGIINYAFSENPHIPLTGGIVRPISTTAPKGTIMNPTFPASVGVRYATAHRIYNVVLGALAKAVVNKVPAAGAGQATMVVLSVPQPETGLRDVSVLEPIFGGGGATSIKDGVAGVDSCAGYLKNTPVESIEANIPVQVKTYELLPNSSGAGRQRGGWGTRFDFEVLEPDSIVTARGMERTRFEPWGLAGGGASCRTEAIINLGTNKEKRIGRIDTLYLEPGDTVSIQASGGGGYGNPFERDPELVLKDVRSGLLSPEKAEEDYGVIIKDNYLNYPLTKEHRKESENFTINDSNLYDFGPSRITYEETWPPTMSSALAEFLLTLPQAQRSYAKRKIHRWVEDNSSVNIYNQSFSDIWDEIQKMKLS